MGKTPAERQAARRKRDASAGLSSFTDRVPSATVADLRSLCEALRLNPHLELSPVPLRHAASGKLVGLKSALAVRK